MASKNNKKEDKEQGVFPGMQTFVEKHIEQEFFWDGVKNEKYFDAASIPGTPGYQASAQGATTYVLYLIFPSKEEQERALRALTNGVRTKLAPGARIGSLNCIATLPKDEKGRSFLEFWEEVILKIVHSKKKKVVTEAEDEAHAPIG